MTETPVFSPGIKASGQHQDVLILANLDFSQRKQALGVKQKYSDIIFLLLYLFISRGLGIDMRFSVKCMYFPKMESVKTERGLTWEGDVGRPQGVGPYVKCVLAALPGVWSPNDLPRDLTLLLSLFPEARGEQAGVS